MSLSFFCRFEHASQLPLLRILMIMSGQAWSCLLATPVAAGMPACLMMLGGRRHQADTFSLAMLACQMEWFGDRGGFHYIGECLPPSLPRHHATASFSSRWKVSPSVIRSPSSTSPRPVTAHHTDINISISIPLVCLSFATQPRLCPMPHAIRRFMLQDAAFSFHCCCCCCC